MTGALAGLDWSIARPSGLGNLHLKRIIKSVEEVEKTGRGGQLHNLWLIEVGAQLVPELVTYRFRVERHLLGETQRHLFLRRKAAPLLQVGQIVDRLLGHAQVPQ